MARPPLIHALAFPVPDLSGSSFASVPQSPTLGSSFVYVPDRTDLAGHNLTQSSSTSAPPSTPSPRLPHHAIPVEPSRNSHKMSTCAKQGYFMPRRLILAADSSSPISPIPSTWRSALNDPHWRQAMIEEFDALIKISTWSLVARSVGVNVVNGSGFFFNKFNTDGSLARYKE